MNMIGQCNKLNKRIWATLLLLSVLWSTAEPSFGNAFSVFVGTKPDARIRIPYNTISGPDNIVARTEAGPLASGAVIQMIFLGANDQLSDPADNGGMRIRGSADDDALITTASVGDDSDTNQTFTVLNGKFFHQIAQNDAAGFGGVTSGRSEFLVLRIWNGALTADGSTFGESQLFSAGIAANAGDPFPVPPPNVALTQDIQVLLAKAAPPPPAITAATGSAPAGAAPTLSATHSRVLGARAYEYEVSNPVARDPASPDTAPTGVSTWGYRMENHLARSKRQADIPGLNGEPASRSESFTLNGDHDFTWVQVRVRAVNDFGPSGWTESSWVAVPQTPDPNAPNAVTNLHLINVVSTPAPAADLTWFAPADRDRLGSDIPVLRYEIRTANRPILDDNVALPAGTEGFFTRWAAASVVPNPPAPTGIGTTQTLQLASLALGLHYFAIKSTDGALLADGSTRFSPISNLTGLHVEATGVQVIAGAAVNDLVITAAAGRNVTMQWNIPTDAQGNALNVTRWELRRADNPIILGAPPAGARAVSFAQATAITLADGQLTRPDQQNLPLRFQAQFDLPAAGDRFFFAIRYFQGAGALETASPISNVAALVLGAGGGGGGGGGGGSTGTSTITGIEYIRADNRLVISARVEGTDFVSLLAGSNPGGPFTGPVGQVLAGENRAFTFTVDAALATDQAQRIFVLDPRSENRILLNRITLRKPEGRFGVNTFANRSDLARLTPAITNLDGFVRYINQFDQAGNAVTGMFWWDSVEQRRQGFIVKYNNENTPVYESTSGVNPAQLTLPIGSQVQINVERPVTFVLAGEL